MLSRDKNKDAVKNSVKDFNIQKYLELFSGKNNLPLSFSLTMSIDI